MFDIRTISISKLMFVLTGMALLVAALWVRFYMPLTLHFHLTQDEYKQIEAYVQSKGGSPDLTSSVMSGNSALAGLGGDWTYLSSNALTGKEAPLIAGTTPTRESQIKVVGKPIQLSVHEATIVDAKALALALKTLHAKSVTLASREGYLLSPAKVRPSFLIQGETSIVLISSSDQAFDWKAPLSPEISSYLATVKVP